MNASSSSDNPPEDRKAGEGAAEGRRTRIEPLRDVRVTDNASAEPDAPTVGTLAKWVPPLSPMRTCGELRALLDRHPDWTAVPVLENGQPRGILSRTHMDTGLIRHFIGDNPALPLERLLSGPPPVIEAHLPLPQALATLAGNTDAGLPEAFILTQAGRYAGFGLSADLVRSVLALHEQEEARFAEQEQRLVDIAETASDWLWERDAEGRYTYVSPRFEEFTGIPLDSVRGLTLSELSKQGPKVEGVEELLTILEARQPYRDVIVRVRYPDGRLQYWQGSGKPIFRPDGTLAGYRGTSRDITTSFQNRLVAESRDEALRRIGQNVPGVIFRLKVDAEGTMSFPFISDRVSEIYGVTPDDVYHNARGRFDDIPPEDRENMRLTLAESRETLEPWRCVYRVRRDGRVIWMHANAHPQRQPDGSTVWDGVSIDITPIKESEQRLRDALAAAEAANAVKREFLATMSHELRTPLNAIIGFAEMIRDQMFGPVGQQAYSEYAEDIRVAGSHLLGLINDILDYAHVEAARVLLIEEKVDLSELIEECVRMLVPRAMEGGVALHADPPSSQICARVDRTRVLQVLINVVTNAVKFTPEGGSVTVRSRVREDEGIEITVEDTGVGIAANDLARVFEPFWQGGGGLGRPSHEGTGLGLPLARRLMDLHGGEIALESEPGKGTTARLTLPRERNTTLSDGTSTAS